MALKPGMTMKLEGLKDLEAALMELPKATGKNVLRRALINAATPMAETARTLAPVRLGHLKRSITVGKVKFSSGSAGKRAFAEAMARGASRSEAGAAAREANIGASQDITSAMVIFGPGRHPQATLQEFGTVHHPPHPYMRPAWDTGKTNAAEAIRDELKTEIEKAAARLARKALRAAAK